MKASNDRPLVFIYYRGGAGRRSLAKLLTRNAARRIAVGIASAIAEGLICLTKIKVLPFRQALTFLELGVKLVVIEPCNAHGTSN